MVYAEHGVFHCYKECSGMTWPLFMFEMAEMRSKNFLQSLVYFHMMFFLLAVAEH